MAAIKVNNGVRQGCPLSALFFILAIEVLAVTIRSDPKIEQTEIVDKTFKISQLADDTTFFLQDIDSLKNVLAMLKNFEKPSNFRIQEKSQSTGISFNLISQIKWNHEA